MLPLHGLRKGVGFRGKNPKTIPQGLKPTPIVGRLRHD